MRKNDFVQIKGLDKQVISGKVKELRQEISALIMDKNMNKLKDLKSIYKKRKDLAQLLTVRRQKQLLEQLESTVKGATE
ncbi:50S ribosomal protein L29 [Candidatus Daviesbacteria bacterium]|nr:50S ribosomal protein L29 [Candidatus Daviesbacteria bacterium]